LGLSGIAYGDVLMDQIGAMDGSGVDTANAFANQDFEAAYDVYDIACCDNFTGNGETVNSIEMVMSGWNGFVDPSGVTGWSANFYSSSAAAGSDLVGDIDSYTVDIADATVDPNWTLANYWLINMTVDMTAGVGDQLVATIPANAFAENGQTACAWSTVGDGVSGGQANPAGGFGFGGWQETAADHSYRINTGGPADPCDSPLGFCPEDIDGNGAINVDDLLIVMGNWGQMGDGTFRPAGDVYPPPYGDCLVNVDDLLAMMGAFGGVCIIEGGCCLGDGSCSVETPADCSAAGGDYFGDDSDCSSGDCSTVACCVGTACSDLTDSACAAIGGTSYAGDCASITCPEPQDNDTCATAIPVTDGDVAIDTTQALTDGPADFNVCDNFGVEDVFNDIWFSYTASCDGNVLMTMCNTIDFDSRISVYDACGGNQLGCNDDALSGACGLMSELMLADVSAGDSMLIRVGGFSEGTGGTGTMNISCAAPTPGSCCMPDDECLPGMDEATCGAFGGSYNGDGVDCADVTCSAEGDNCEEAVVAVDGANPFDTSLATPSGFGAPDDLQCDGTFLDWDESGNDVWMVYSPAGVGTLTVSTCDATSYDTSLVLYAGSDCASLTQVACNGDSTVESGCQSYYSGIYDLPVDGTDIYIRLGGWQAASGAGTCTITFTAAGATGACCVEGTCIGENTMPECDAFGGYWNNGMTCADVTCPAPYVAGGCDVDENADLGCVCFVDGDDSETDCNGGSNLVVPTFTNLNLGESICGTSSVFVDGPTGGTYRDLDWFTSAALDAGGTFDCTIGANSACLILFVNMDTGTVDFVADHVAGYTNTTSITLPAGNWAAVAAVSDWNVAWTCGSGLETYTMLIQ